MMGQVIVGYDVDEVLYKTSKALLSASEYSPRNKKTKELIQLQLEISDPTKCIITNPGRKLSLDYLKSEFEWYKSCDKTIEKIGERASLWKKITNQDGTVNSNYGEIVFKQKLDNYYGSQFDWVIHSLIKDQSSRQAIINFNQPKHKYVNNKDFVCTINTQYLIRDSKLYGFTNIRSNDLIYGFSYDFPFFSWLQQLIANTLKLDLGSNIHSACSMHVYEKHFTMLERIIQHSNSKSKTFDEVGLV